MSDVTQRVYRAFSPAPLTPDEHSLYVDLDDARGNADIVRRLGQKVRLADRPTCQVLAGHKGSGKSTELLRLQKDLETKDPKFFVVFCKADEDIDRNDIDFPEVLMAIVKQMASQLKTDAGIELKPGYFKRLPERLKNFLTTEVDFEKLELSHGFAKISGILKSSPTARDQIRKLLEPETNNLLNAANDLIGEAVLKLSQQDYSGLVILVDDLDKMVVRPHNGAGCTTAEYLFVNRSAQLTAFACHVIYTMPLSLAYSHQEQAIRQTYGGHVPVVPMTKISTRPPDSKPYPQGIEKFRQIIAARREKAQARKDELFENDEVMTELIRLSGGQPTELMTLVREAIITTGMPITHRSLERAKREGQREYARQLRQDHWPILDEVRRSGNFVRTKENDLSFRELIDSRAMLQYVNDDEWYGLNPMVADLQPPGRGLVTP
jgi:hypothetical protein